MKLSKKEAEEKALKLILYLKKNPKEWQELSDLYFASIFAGIPNQLSPAIIWALIGTNPSCPTEEVEMGSKNKIVEYYLSLK